MLVKSPPTAAGLTSAVIFEQTDIVVKIGGFHFESGEIINALFRDCGSADLGRQGE
jgi:hypothetical protein